MRYIVNGIIVVLFISGCSLLMPVKEFSIYPAEIRNVKVNKVKQAAINEKYIDNKNNQYLEVVFKANINLSKLMVNGAFVPWGFYNLNKRFNVCMVYDENIKTVQRHFAMHDYKLKNITVENDDLIKPIKKLFTYSCVIDRNSVVGNKILFHVEVSKYILYEKYISNSIVVSLPPKKGSDLI